MKKKNLVERISLTLEEFTRIERNMLDQEHLRRYGSIRRFAYGDVLDFASGCGYGTYMLAGNPDVKTVTGVDNSKEGIDWAKKEFSHEKITFLQQDVMKLKNKKFDTLVCLETIEHIKDRSFIPKIVEKYNIDNIIVSFPDKVTTHYNKFHYHDFVRQEVIDLFPNHLIYHSLRFMDSQSLMFVRIPKNVPAKIYRNTRDLV